jgi:hypothetical protein
MLGDLDLGNDAEEFWSGKGTGGDKLAYEQKGVIFTPADPFLGTPLEGSLELQAHIWWSTSGRYFCRYVSRPGARRGRRARIVV